MVSGARLLPRRVRPRLRAAVGLLCLALVAGCGQTASETSAPPASSSSTAPGEPTRPTARAGVPVRKIVGLGDSVMGGTACDCEGPIDALATRLEQRPGAERIARVNLGTDGATTTDVADIVESEDWQADVRDADVIVVIVGAGMTYVDLVKPFRGPSGDSDPTPLLADDGDHPNAAGVDAIADALAAKVP